MNELSVAAHRAPVTLDMSGSVCPIPLLAAKRLLDDLPDGQALVLISDCPGTGGDLRAWAEVTGYALVAAEALAGGRTAYTIVRNGADRNPANVVLDMRGACCPGPILEAKRLLDGMQPGEVLVLLSNCPGAPSDIASWTDSTTVELVDVFEVRRGEYEFYLRRRHRNEESGCSTK
ncbi:MAG: sulfurtransferase TusA family protein [Sutterellaceae bacterium]|nr:sulfurtransferase TusA family protein [Burkholderiaceae bacterium]MDW8429246.1 sulfurtransferase TusA family protein [Sutterellaceae bacterium]